MVNGLQTAGNYDLNTVILRDEWKYDGIVMTDWWAMINEEGKSADRTNYAAMIRAQNDIYMVCAKADSNKNEDNICTSLEDGSLTIGELQRSAKNICRFLINTHAFQRMNGIMITVESVGENAFSIMQEQEIVYYHLDKEVTIQLEEVKAVKNSEFVFALDMENPGGYRVAITARSELSELSQMPVTLFHQSTPNAMFVFNGTGGYWHTIEKKVVIKTGYSVFRLRFGQNGLDPKEIRFIFDKQLEEINDESIYVKS